MASRLPACAALLSGCASLTGLHQAVSVDSTPRGALVEIRDSEPVGPSHTPFFTKVERASELTFVVNDVAQRQRCRLRFAAVFLGNAPLLFIPSSLGLLYAGAVSIDFLTGGAWECPSRLKLSAPPEAEKTTNSLQPSKEKPCDKALFVAVDAPGPQEAAALEAAWRGRPKRKECIQLISHGLADGLLSRRGFLEIDTFEAGRRKLERHGPVLGLGTQATHFLLVKSEERKGREVFVAKKLDAHTLSQEEETIWGDGAGAPRRRASLWSAITGLAVRLVPNSAGLTSSSTEFQQSLPDSNLSVASHAGLGVNLSTVSHPDEYSSWDFALDLAPSAGFRYMNLNLEPLPGLAAEHKYRVVSGSGDLLGALTLHTPLGAVTVAGGVGGVLYDSFDRDSGRTEQGLGLGIATRLSYLVFFSGRVFGEAAVHNLVMPQGSQALSPHRSFDRSVVLSLTLGMHYPEFALWTGRVLSRR